MVEECDVRTLHAGKNLVSYAAIQFFVLVDGMIQEEIKERGADDVEK